MYKLVSCIVQSSHASWKVLDFFLENSRIWKVLENYFGPGNLLEIKAWGPGKSWKNILENCAFFIGLNGKQAAIVYHAVFVDCCLLKYCIQQFQFFSARFAHLNTYFFIIFKHSWATKRSWKICHGVLESPGKVLDFFVSKRVGILIVVTEKRHSPTRWCLSLWKKYSLKLYF